MATYVLIHGAGSDAWYWHLVAPELQARGHDVVAMDLPCDDDSAGFEQYRDAVIAAIGTRRDELILVAQSLGGFTAPMVCERMPVRALILVAAMVPAPGESAGDWWANTGWPQPPTDDPMALFLHDVPADIAAASAEHVRNQSGTPFVKPWPMQSWPSVPTRFLLCRDDRFFPAEFQRRVVKERLGITPEEMEGGHLPALARPADLAQRLAAFDR
jgi:pimeloyl-ACP methyl ester carboxylesterase